MTQANHILDRAVQWWRDWRQTQDDVAELRSLGRGEIEAWRPSAACRAPS